LSDRSTTGNLDGVLDPTAVRSPLCPGPLVGILLLVFVATTIYFLDRQAIDGKGGESGKRQGGQESSPAPNA
jgi:hypothetical protein